MEPNSNEAPAGGQVDALDMLALEGEQLEGAATSKAHEAQAQREQQQQSGTAAELYSALEMVRMMAAPAFAWWPEFGQCWGDGQLQAISESGAEVMQRHGWSMSEAFTKYGPYIALIGATLPPSLATYQAIRERREQLARPQPAGQGGAS